MPSSSVPDTDITAAKQEAFMAKMASLLAGGATFHTNIPLEKIPVALRGQVRAG